MPAAVTITNELTVNVTIASTNVSYTTMEAAILTAGFASFRIARTVNVATTDVVITCWPPSVLGIVQPFNAQDALAKIAVAVGKFGN